MSSGFLVPGCFLMPPSAFTDIQKNIWTNIATREVRGYIGPPLCIGVMRLSVCADRGPHALAQAVDAYRK